MAQDMERVSGIGPATVELLKAHGFTTVADLANASIAALSQVPGFGPARSGQVIANAKTELETTPSDEGTTTKAPKAKKVTAKKADVKKKDKAKKKDKGTDKKKKKGDKKEDKKDGKKKGKTSKVKQSVKKGASKKSKKKSKKK